MKETAHVYGAPAGCQVWDWVLYIGHPHGADVEWRLWDPRLFLLLWWRVGWVLIISWSETMRRGKGCAGQSKYFSYRAVRVPGVWGLQDVVVL